MAPFPQVTLAGDLGWLLHPNLGTGAALYLAVGILRPWAQLKTPTLKVLSGAGI